MTNGTAFCARARQQWRSVSEGSQVASAGAHECLAMIDFLIFCCERPAPCVGARPHLQRQRQDLNALRMVQQAAS